MIRLDYRRDIDGLRAVAITPVVVFHLMPEWLRGGYLGVDVFFVISGYLITTLVLREVSAGSFSLRRFWARRVRRLVPALLAMVATTLACGLAVLPRFELRPLGEQAAAAMLSFANIFFWRRAVNYWNADVGETPLLHTWSLSVEEQFYLLFPLIMPPFARRGMRSLTLLLVGGTVASLALFVMGGRVSGNATFYLLPTRAWELGVGCCLALLDSALGDHGREGRSWQTAAVAGLGAIIFAYVTPHRSVLNNVIVVFATAVIIAGSRAGLVQRLLSAPPLPLVGRMSYSIYLWHWPVIVFAGVMGLGAAVHLQLAATLVLAAASYQLVERPTRHMAWTVPACAVALLAVLGLSVRVMNSAGYDVSRFALAHSHAECYSIVPTSSLQPGATVRTGPDNKAAIEFIGRPVGPAPDMSMGILVGSAPPVELICMGDSHGLTWAWAIESIARARGVQARIFTAAGVSGFPLPAVPLRWTDRLHFLAANTPMTGAQERAWCEARVSALAQATPSAIVIFGVRWATVDTSRARATLAFLADRKADVILIEQPPEVACSGQDVGQWLASRGVDPLRDPEYRLPQGNVEEYERGRAVVRRLAADHAGCRLVPTRDLFLSDDGVLVMRGRTLLYSDDDHLTDEGVMLAEDRIAAEIAAIRGDR
ncbi:MAG: acyltransferase [Planctomycetia bacterium]|nr:acyltransferase [Planctomycetia bacterium]